MRTSEEHAGTEGSRGKCTSRGARSDLAQGPGSYDASILQPFTSARGKRCSMLLFVVTSRVKPMRVMPRRIDCPVPVTRGRQRVYVATDLGN